VQVFGSHFAAGTGMNSEGADLDALRTRQAVGLREWAAQFGDGPRVIVGDLNARPGERPYQEIAKQYADSWALLRPDDPGLTFSADPGNAPLEKRIDYWFAERGSRVQAVAIERPEFPAGPLSDHYALTVTYLLGPRRVGAEP
jgi:endonuclease/exonuclease/phosphatase family metal-dependent hydrolase